MGPRKPVGWFRRLCGMMLVGPCGSAWRCGPSSSGCGRVLTPPGPFREVRDWGLTHPVGVIT